jgi:hypothetical protein
MTRRKRSGYIPSHSEIFGAKKIYQHLSEKSCDSSPVISWLFGREMRVFSPELYRMFHSYKTTSLSWCRLLLFRQSGGVVINRRTFLIGTGCLAIRAGAAPAQVTTSQSAKQTFSGKKLVPPANGTIKVACALFQERYSN